MYDDVCALSVFPKKIDVKAPRAVAGFYRGALILGLQLEVYPCLFPLLTVRCRMITEQ